MKTLPMPTACPVTGGPLTVRRLECEESGVVIEGRFHDDVFVGDNLLVKHSENYHPPAAGEPIDVEALKDSLR